MAGRKKSKGKGRKTSKKRSSARQSYAGLTRKQLIARLRAAHAGRGTSKRKKGRRKARGLTYSQKVKYGLVTPIPKGHLEKAHGSDLYRYNDPGRKKRGKKGGKKGRKRPLSAWQRFIKANKNRRGMRKKNGMLNLRALATAYRKSPAGKKAKKASGRKSPKRGKKRGGKKRSSRRDYGWY